MYIFLMNFPASALDSITLNAIILFCNSAINSSEIEFTLSHAVIDNHF